MSRQHRSKKKSRLQFRRLRITSSKEWQRGLGFESLESKTLLAADVYTDQSDYPPGATAIVRATGYQLGETVEFEVNHINEMGTVIELGGEGHEPWFVTDGGPNDQDGVVDGNILTDWYVNPDDSLNESFRLTAIGQNSGDAATWTFTDSDNTEPQRTTLWPPADLSFDDVILDPNANLEFADLDGNGQLDIISFGCVMRVYFAIDGEYVEDILGQLDSCGGPLAYGIGDFEIEVVDSDGDGDLDIYATNQDLLYVWKNESEGLIAPNGFDHAGFRPLFFRGHHPIGAGDFNDDQIVDLVVADLDQGLLGPSLGIRFIAETVFEDQVVLPTRGFLALPFLDVIRDIEVLDANTDGLPDIMVVGSNFSLQETFIVTYVNSGGGPFERSTVRIPGDTCVFESPDTCYTRQIETGDVNGDQFPDLVVQVNGELQVWYSMSPDDRATIDEGTDFDTNILHVADVNSDGRDDIIAKNSTNGNIVWFASRTTRGEFAPRQLLQESGQGPTVGDDFPQRPISVVDIDDDDINEVLTLETVVFEDELGESVTGGIIIATEYTSPSIPGDVNGDDTVDFTDFLILSENFGRNDNVAFEEGDLNGNGQVDFADFLILSENFGD